MPVKVMKKEGESSAAMMYRFTKKIQQGGILKEAKKRRFYERPKNRNKRRVLALKRETKKAEVQYKKRWGLL